MTAAEAPEASTTEAEDSWLDVDLRWEHLKGRLFLAGCVAASLFGVFVLALLIADVLWEAILGVVQHDVSIRTFLTQPASRHADQAGFYAAIVGSVWLMIFTVLLSFFIGVGTAVYLEEFAPDNRWTRLIEANLANLAGVPSIVYGLLVLAAVVNFTNPLTGGRVGPILLAGAVALALLITPIIIVASQEALRGVPDGVRRGSLATGATRWQTVKNVVLPAAFPGILTGTILAVARAIGETAPLIMVGAILTARRVPEGPFDTFGSMPTMIYYWADRPEITFHYLAALGIVVLLTILIAMNGVAVYLRNKYETQQ